MEKAKRKRMIAPIGAVVATLLLALACMMIGMETWQAHAADVTGQYNILMSNNLNDTQTKTGLVISKVSPTPAVYKITAPLDPFAPGDDWIVDKVVLKCADGGTKTFTCSDTGFTLNNLMSSDLKDTMTLKYASILYTYVRVSVPLPEEPTKEGYHFVGWYYGEDSGAHTACTAYDGEPIYADTALHAHFAINTYVVTYFTAGGSAVDPATVDWQTTAPSRTTTRTGYNFVGWFLEDGTEYTNQPITSDTTLAAHWEIQMFTVTFYANDGVLTSLSVPYGTKLVSAMETANVVAYHTFTAEGVRMSKLSTVTEDTAVVVKKLTKYEKFGDYVGQHKWVLWTTVCVVVALGLTCGICIVILVKRR